jgi:hypothetical protein
MYVHVDASQIPPVVEVRDPDQFTSFSVVVSTPAHVWLEPEAVARLAGRTGDEAWQEEFAAMAAYARSKGWVDGSGRLRAHVEVRTADDHV